MGGTPTLHFTLDETSPDQDRFYGLFLLALCVWREARGETRETKVGVACSVRNRAFHQSWWGNGWVSVILKPWQYSSFNPGDPNAVKWPSGVDTSWMESLAVAADVFCGNAADTTGGATHYFDRSLDDKPPSWATDSSMVHTVDIGGLHFYRRAG